MHAKTIYAASDVRQHQSATSPPFLAQLREIAEQMEPHGLAPAGNRVISPRDLATHLGGAAIWWERHRQRLVDAGLLVKAGRRFVGDLRAIQEAIANPELWADAE